MMSDIETLVLADVHEMRRQMARHDKHRNIDEGEFAQSLSVLTDQLKESGDPRGEWIASREVPSMTAWLGSELCDMARLSFGAHNLTVEVQYPTSEDLRRLCESDARIRISAISLRGDSDELETLLKIVAQQELPWLEFLGIQSVDVGRPMSEDVVDAAIVATPRLLELEARGANVLVDFPHPSIVHVSVSDIQTVGAIAGSGRPFEKNLTSLSMFEATYRRRPIAPKTLQRAIPSSHCREVSILNVSQAVTAIPVFAFVDDLVERLDMRRLWLPAIVTPDDAAHVLRIVSRARRLEYLDVRANHVLDLPIDHPFAEIRIPSRRPWPHREVVRGMGFLIRWGMEQRSVSVEAAVGDLEARAEQMSPASIQQWRRIFSVTDSMGEERLVFDEFMDLLGDLVNDEWRILQRDMLRSKSDEVTIQREI